MTIGNKNMTLFARLRGLINLTSERKVGEVDIYCCAKAKFLLVSPSVPDSVAYLFNTPVALIGIQIWNYSYSGMLVALQPMFNKLSEHRLTFRVG